MNLKPHVILLLHCTISTQGYLVQPQATIDQTVKVKKFARNTIVLWLYARLNQFLHLKAVKCIPKPIQKLHLL